MADDTAQEFDPQFFGLIASLHQTAMIEMGKLMNPVTGNAERRLENAQRTIDLIAMLQRKTEGNLSRQEKDYIEHVLYELRMNFVDESESPSSSDSSDGETPKTDEGAKPESEPKPDNERTGG